jgi:hypothetical protein
MLRDDLPSAGTTGAEAKPEEPLSPGVRRRRASLDGLIACPDDAMDGNRIRRGMSRRIDLRVELLHVFSNRRRRSIVTAVAFTGP